MNDRTLERIAVALENIAEAMAASVDTDHQYECSMGHVSLTQQRRTRVDVGSNCRTCARIEEMNK